MGRAAVFVTQRITEMIERAPSFWAAKKGFLINCAKTELAPPSVGELAKVPGELMAVPKNLANASNLTLRQAIFGAVVFAEVSCWFFVGEVLGKRHIIGYYLGPEAKNTYQKGNKHMFDSYPDEE